MQVIIFHRANALFVLETLVSGYHVSRIIMAHPLIHTPLDFKQHGIKSQAIAPIIRSIHPLNACGAVLADVEKTERHQLFVVVQTHFPGAVHIGLFFVQQGFFQGIRQHAGECISVSLIKRFFFFV